jgi:hypothetical protein
VFAGKTLTYIEDEDAAQNVPAVDRTITLTKEASGMIMVKTGKYFGSNLTGIYRKR